MGDHNKALETLVYQVKDLPGAEKFVDQVSQPKTPLRKELLTSLMRVYLSPDLS